MKPLKLVMSAFGPYPSCERVDFTRFHEVPLFLIHGRTGAGKSSILDALCFALYGVASGAERQSAQLRSQWAEPDRLTEVTLDFALGSTVYRIRRRPAQKRPRRRGEGMREVPPTACLWKRRADLPEEEDGTPIAEGVRDVTEAIESLTGLTAKQFRQVIVLPQGEFRKLISATSTEREAILDSLFDTSVFARIQEMLKSRAAELGRWRLQILSERKSVLEGLGLNAECDDDEACIRLNALVSTIDKKRAEIADRQARLQAELVAVRACSDALADHGHALANLEKAQEAFNAAQKEAKEAEKTWQVALAGEEKRLSLQRRRDALQEHLEEVKRYDAALRERNDVERICAEVTRELASCREKRKQIDAEIRTIEQELMKLAAAGERKQRLQQERDTLQKAMAQRKRLRALEKQIAEAEDACEVAARALKEAKEHLEVAEKRSKALQQSLHASHAVMLAMHLRPGEPCPVCGSLDHPQPARAERKEAPDEATIVEAEAMLAEARAVFEAKREEAARAERSRDALRAERRSIQDVLLVSELSDEAVAQHLQRVEARLAETEKAAARQEALAERLACLREALPELEQRIERLMHEERAALEHRAALRARIAEIEARLPEEMRDLKRLQAEIAHAEETLVRLERERATAETAWREAVNRLNAAEGRLQQAQEEHLRTENALQEAYRRCKEAGLDDLTRIDFSQSEELSSTRKDLAARLESLQATIEDLQQEEGRLQERLEVCEDRRRALQRLQKEDAALRAEHDRMHALAELAAGDNPLKTSLQRYVLAVLFDEILQAANLRLQVMSERRYLLERRRTIEDRRRAGGLELDVYDAWTGESRPVQTLSGGEGFLAALALALGMADVVQTRSGGIRMQTLFVDEGFGALDSEALDKALLTLESLHGEGRMIGIISHVGELRERIPARLEVIRTPQGSRICHHAP